MRFESAKFRQAVLASDDKIQFPLYEQFHGASAG
jgi:hypothetical protein